MKLLDNFNTIVSSFTNIFVVTALTLEDTVKLVQSEVTNLHELQDERIAIEYLKKSDEVLDAIKLVQEKKAARAEAILAAA